MIRNRLVKNKFMHNKQTADAKISVIADPWQFFNAVMAFQSVIN